MRVYLKEVYESVVKKQESLSKSQFKLWEEKLDQIEKTMLLRMLSCIQLASKLDSSSVVFSDSIIKKNSFLIIFKIVFILFIGVALFYDKEYP
jgi:hypothetical protein